MKHFRSDRPSPMARPVARPVVRRGLVLGLGLAVALLLAGCGGPAPQPVEAVPDQVGSIDLQGPLRVHYNLLPTLALGEAVAREYGVERRADTALLVIALRQPDADGQEVTAPGQVQAEAVDLSGRRQAVALHPVTTGGYIDHVGTVNTAARDSLRVEVAVTTDAGRQAFDFQRNF